MNKCGVPECETDPEAYVYCKRHFNEKQHKVELQKEE